jgi:NTE family protein
MTTTALVLGSGGQTGAAWELGILAGLADEGIDLTDADTVVGTSAGSVVGAQIRAGVSVERLYADQLAPPTHEIAARIGVRFWLMVTAAVLRSSDPVRFRQRIGVRALRAKTIPADRRREVVATRLPSRDWPDGRLLIVAVDAVTGTDAVFDRNSGVSLADAVTASCAVPTIWPCTPIGGRRFMDGGLRSWANADLAAGADRVVVLAPMYRGGGPMRPVAEQVAMLRETASVAVVVPDADSAAAMGGNVLDPSRRAPSAEAGRRQASHVAQDVRDVWMPAR